MGFEVSDSVFETSAHDVIVDNKVNNEETVCSGEEESGGFVVGLNWVVIADPVFGGVCPIAS